LARPSADPNIPPVPAADLRAIFDRAVEPLLREHEEPLRREVAEAMAKSQEASERVRVLSQDISERDGRIAGLLGDLEEARGRARSLDEAVSERDGRIAGLLGDLEEARERARSLDKAVSEREGRIAGLLGDLEEARERSRSLDAAVFEQEGRIAELSGKLAEAGERVRSLDQAVSEREGKIASFEEELRSLKYKNQEDLLELESIKASFTWNAVTKWHNSIFERFFSQDSKRRDFYQICIKSMRIIQREGFKEFFLKAKKYVCKNKKFPGSSHKCHGVSNLCESSGIDIIVPVYNSFFDVKKCIESILSYTKFLNFNIYVVDDFSTDPQLIRYLEYLQNNINNFNLIRNSENLGFVKSVNKGIILTKNDVVLLNSDTIVSSNWLNEILTCAYMDDKIATVTPLSNNATICSVPDFCNYNEIPYGYTVQQFSNIIYNISKKLDMGYVQIPTGVGFCLFIKRKVINEIGIFDEIYGRGYNEENDFCMRAFHNGYFHVCCTSAFVYHKGRASFKKEQADLETTNQKILLARYPEYLSLINDFASKNPLKLLQDEIKLAVERHIASPENQISIGIDCQLLNRDVWTGSERYIFYLVENILISDRINRYFLYSKNEIMDALLNEDNNPTRKFATNSLSIFLDSEYIDVFHRTVQCFNVEDLILLLKSKSSVITILDLILYKYPSYFDTTQEAERYQLLTELSARIADKIIAISSHAKYDIVKTLQVPEEKVDVIHLAIDQKFRRINKDEEDLMKFKDKYKLSDGYILYIGTDFPHKNIDLAIKSYKQLTGILSPSPELVIAGPSTSLKRRSAIKKLIDGDKRIRILDYVDDNDIVNLYNCSGLFVYPSLYEGFGLPILESMACGIPVIASNETSIPEVAGNAALLVDATDTDELCRSMYKVLINTELRQNLIESGLERVKEFNWKKTAEETVETYKTAYKKSKGLNEKLDESTRQLLRSLFNKISESERMLILDSLGQNSEDYSILVDLFENK
jgi:glycosyltransferase involved in cell wall biosynthesis